MKKDAREREGEREKGRSIIIIEGREGQGGWKKGQEGTEGSGKARSAKGREREEGR